MGKRGPSKQPTEKKRALGNPGQKALPDLDNVVALRPLQDAVPMRPLGSAGQRMWDHYIVEAGRWLAPSDLDLFTHYCEAADEFLLLKQKWVRAEQERPDDDHWRLRVQVEKARDAVIKLADRLGFAPSARAELGVAEVRAREGMIDILNRTAADAAPPPVTIDVYDE